MFVLGLEFVGREEVFLAKDEMAKFLADIFYFILIEVQT